MVGARRAASSGRRDIVGARHRRGAARGIVGAPRHRRGEAWSGRGARHRRGAASSERRDIGAQVGTHFSPLTGAKRVPTSRADMHGL
jgi:hypothetical protein